MNERTKVVWHMTRANWACMACCALLAMACFSKDAAAEAAPESGKAHAQLLCKVGSFDCTSMPHGVFSKIGLQVETFDELGDLDPIAVAGCGVMGRSNENMFLSCLQLFNNKPHSFTVDVGKACRKEKGEALFSCVQTQWAIWTVVHRVLPVVAVLLALIIAAVVVRRRRQRELP